MSNSIQIPHTVGEFTRTQRRILEMLNDGTYRTREELLTCLQDSQADYSTLSVHIFNIRRIIERKGFFIATIRLGRKNCISYYQLVRHISR